MSDLCLHQFKVFPNTLKQKTEICYTKNISLKLQIIMYTRYFCSSKQKGNNITTVVYKNIKIN